MHHLPAIDAIETFVPERSVAIEDLAGPLQLKRAQVRLLQRVHGLRRLRHAPNSGLLDLVVPAARKALVRVAAPEEIGYVLFVHSTQELTPSFEDAAQMIAAELNLSHAQSFAVTQQNCASALAAIEIAGALLQAEGDEASRVLIVTGDKAFTPMNQLLYNSGSLMGEASAAILVSAAGAPDADQVLSYATRTLGQYSDGLLMSVEQSRDYGRDGARALAEVMQEAIDMAGLEWSEVEKVIPHNAHMKETVDLLGIDQSQVALETLEEYSHCYTSDVFLNYNALREEGRLVTGGNYVFAASGLGATYSAMVINHEHGMPRPSDRPLAHYSQWTTGR